MQVSDQQAMTPEIIEKISSAGVIAVLVIDKEEHALPLAEALLKGGVDTIELTMRTPAALEAAKIIKKNMPEICLGMGTVLTTGQVKACSDIGADFAVAPGCNPKIISAAYALGLSFAPGVVTPSDIEVAIQEGCRVMKYFPAETAGGIKHLSNMAAPYQYLGLRFIPLGGLNIDNAASYLQSSLITAIGGSWIAKRDMILAEDWDGISENARQIRALISEIRNKKSEM